MPQVHSDPQEIRRFQASLRQFNSEIPSSTSRIRAQLRSLSVSWRDQKYQRFSQEMETAIAGFERYLQGADGYLRHLDSKATPLESYQGGALVGRARQHGAPTLRVARLITCEPCPLESSKPATGRKSAR